MTGLVLILIECVWFMAYQSNPSQTHKQRSIGRTMYTSYSSQISHFLCTSTRTIWLITAWTS